MMITAGDSRDDDTEMAGADGDDAMDTDAKPGGAPTLPPVNDLLAVLAGEADAADAAEAAAKAEESAGAPP